MAANMSWKTEKAMEGMRGLPIDGWARTPFMPKYSARESGCQAEKMGGEKGERTEIANICASCFAECEGETPEKPLVWR